jgi:carbon starvation protein
MRSLVARVFWIVVAGLGGWAYAALALHRGEALNSSYVLIAALCSYAIGFRFYSKWIAARVLALNDLRATPCEVHDDGRDFVRTNKWIVFGHHFAAISGPGPLVGPVLAAQFGYLPGTLWILIGVTLGGAVQDFVVLFCSLRRDGKSLGQMVKEELNTTAGLVALVAILAIITILLSVLGLVVVKALAESPWGVFTVGATIPIAMFMGNYLRFWRVGKVLEATAIGVVCLLLAVWAGKLVYENPAWARIFGLRDITLAWGIIGYGLAASVLPVWLLLAPRDYLSTFMKLGTILALTLGIFVVLPSLQMPALTKFADGSGLVFAGKIFPFCFITIACGAISGFHTLIASGTTPKILTRESYARPIGYGAMCLESLVAIMALIAACTLQPGVYLSMNVKGEPAATVATVTSLGFPVTREHMDELANQLGEKTLFGRTGGAATLAVGMAQIFSKVVNGRGLDLWYHFAIMFEALFILTTLDAGTRVGRYLLQDALSQIWKPLGRTRSVGANVIASVLMVSSWGYFLIQGVRDPLGGINSLWPLFGIANQMLAAIALCLATTVILKMQLAGAEANALPASEGKERNGLGQSPKPPQPAVRNPALALITFVPLAWLLAVTITAGIQKIGHPDPRIGFLAQAHMLNEAQKALEQSLSSAKANGTEAVIESAGKALRTNRILHFNNLLDAAVALTLLLLTMTIVFVSAREWWLLLSRRRPPVLRETVPIWVSASETERTGWMRLAGLVPLAFALLKELSMEASIERAQEAKRICDCRLLNANRATAGITCGINQSKSQTYLEVTEQRYKGVTRCC